MPAAHGITQRTAGPVIQSTAQQVQRRLAAYQQQILSSSGAAVIGITDAGSFFTDSTVEGSLQEIGSFANRLLPSVAYHFLDDFDTYQSSFTALDHGWLLLTGTDPQALIPDIDNSVGGSMLLTAGDDAGGTVATNGSQMVGYTPSTADQGNLIFEAMVQLQTSVTDGVICVGFTDNPALEMPFTIAAGDVITAVADDAVCFVYDVRADTDEWFVCAVDSTVVDAASATTGIAPVADTWYRLTISVSTDGATILFGINGVTVATMTGDTGVSPDVSLYPTVAFSSAAATSHTARADYVFLSHDR